jgi:SAM-dependent methyltransferase
MGRFDNFHKERLDRKNLHVGGNYCHERRVREGFFEKYFQGCGIDIGCGCFPITKENCRLYDISLNPKHDASHMAEEKDESYDWVYSSHCLEHVDRPAEAVRNWWRILKPGGFLIVVVPDLVLFEKNRWPREKGYQHKFALSMGERPVPAHFSLFRLLDALPMSQIKYIRTGDDSFDYDKGRGIGEIESVTWKLPEKYRRWSKD